MDPAHAGSPCATPGWRCEKSERARGSSESARSCTVPKRTGPSSRSRDIASAARSLASSTARAWASSASPATVRSRSRPRLRKSGRPTSAASLVICRLTAEGVRPTVRAALAMEPCSPVATKVANRSTGKCLMAGNIVAAHLTRVQAGIERRSSLRTAFPTGGGCGPAEHCRS